MCDFKPKLVNWYEHLRFNLFITLYCECFLSKKTICRVRFWRAGCIPNPPKPIFVKKFQNIFEIFKKQYVAPIFSPKIHVWSKVVPTRFNGLGARAYEGLE